MCSGSEAGSHLRLVDFVYHSTLGLRVINKKSARKNRHAPRCLGIWIAVNLLLYTFICLSCPPLFLSSTPTATPGGPSAFLSRNVKRFRGGLVCKAHKLLYHSTLGSRVIKKKKKCLAKPYTRVCMGYTGV